MRKRTSIILVAFTVVLCLSGIIYYQLFVPKFTVTQFDYRELYDESLILDGTSETAEYEVTWLLGSVHDKIRTKDTADSISYGVIVVARPLKSENFMLRSEDMQYLSPYWIYSDMRSFSANNYHYTNRVKTTLEIVDVVYESYDTDLEPGKQVATFESYFILDQRVAKILEIYGGKDYLIKLCNDLETYYPMEIGETYLLFMRYFPKDHALAKNEPILQGTGICCDTYCLSDPSKPAGFGHYPLNTPIVEERYRWNWAYVKTNFGDVVERYGSE